MKFSLSLSVNATTSQCLFTSLAKDCACDLGDGLITSENDTEHTALIEIDCCNGKKFEKKIRPSYQTNPTRLKCSPVEVECDK